MLDQYKYVQWENKKHVNAPPHKTKQVNMILI